MLIDSHAHLTDRKLMSDLRNVLSLAGEAELEAIVTVGTDPESNRAVAKLVQEAPDKRGADDEWPEVYGTVGVHPHDAKVVTDAVLAEMADLAAGERIVAIGETGLDFYRDLSPRDAERVLGSLGTDRFCRFGGAGWREHRFLVTAPSASRFSHALQPR